MPSLIRVDQDFETASECDLRKHGVSRYARHPSTRALMLAYSVDFGPVRQWMICDGEPMPRDLSELLADPNAMFWAWNELFEWSIWREVLKVNIPISRCRDIMAVAYSLSLPGSLEECGEVLRLERDKRKESRGKALLRRFTVPQKPTKNKPWVWRTKETDPEEWDEFCAYNRQDVVAQQAIWKRIQRWDLPPHEWAIWEMDRAINYRGIPVNLKAVENAIRVNTYVVKTRMDEMREITKLDNPNSGAQLLPWLKQRGYPFNDLRKGHVAAALDEVTRKDVKRVLQLRQETSKSSVKKYHAYQAATDEDGLFRHAHQYAGAGRTWRWAGRKVQVQNLPRPTPDLEKCQEQAIQHLTTLSPEVIDFLYDRPMDLLSTCTRPVIQAPPGFVFVDADLNAIENRVLGFIANDQKILDVFRAGRCPYVDFATYMFQQPYDVLWNEYKAGNKEKRTTSKPAVLGCGYLLGPGEIRIDEDTGEQTGTGLLGYAWNMGVKLTLEQAQLAVKTFRETYTDVVKCWWKLEDAAVRCVDTDTPQEVGPLEFFTSGPFLCMRLPSGRNLYYVRPEVQRVKTPWGGTKRALTYEGRNDKKQWVRIKTHPGKIMENADQAIARDILAHGLRLAKYDLLDLGMKLDIRLHVHDQGVALVPEDKADKALKILQQCLSHRPRWAPDLPLAAAGTISKYFFKD